jgi:hypothetical protein
MIVTKDSETNKKSKKLILITIFLLFLILLLYFITSRKPFPVEKGQTWVFRKNAIPFTNNHPEDEVLVEYHVKIIDIKDDGNIVYSRGCDSMELDLDNFLFHAELLTN